MSLIWGFFPLQLTWYQAQATCKGNGMRLATIKSREESDQIKRLIRESGKYLCSVSTFKNHEISIGRSVQSLVLSSTEA